MPSDPSPLEPGAPDPFPVRQPRTGPAGCGKPVWVGCGVLLALLGIAAVIFLVKAPDLFAWVMERTKANVLTTLPASTTTEEIERLEAAFDAAVAAVVERRADPADLQHLQAVLLDYASKQGHTREEVQELVEALEKVGGVEPSPAAPEEAEPSPARSVAA